MLKQFLSLYPQILYTPLREAYRAAFSLAKSHELLFPLVRLAKSSLNGSLFHVTEVTMTSKHFRTLR